jgi:hypothetical protein
MTSVHLLKPTVVMTITSTFFLRFLLGNAFDRSSNRWTIEQTTSQAKKNVIHCICESFNKVRKRNRSIRWKMLL